MSGSTIGGIAGAAVGFWIGGPAGARWGWMIGSAVGGYADPDVIEGPRIKDAQVQTSQEGVPRPILYGTSVVGGNVIQIGPLIERKKKERAGKGGPVQVTYSYYRTYAVRICEAAPLGGEHKLRRVWRDDKLVYSAVAGDTIDAESRAFGSKITFYSGSETQLPSPILEALPAANGGGVGNVPAYRGSCYAVIANDDLTERQGAIPQYRWEISSQATVGATTTDLDPLLYASDVYPWIANASASRDPRKPGVDYEYGYVNPGLGYEAAIYGYTSPEAAIDAAIASGITNGRTYADLTLRAWRQWENIDASSWQGAESVYPWSGGTLDANTKQAVSLIYSRYPAAAEVSALDMDYVDLRGPDFTSGKWVHNPTGDQAGGRYTGVFVYQPTLDAGTDDGFANWQGDDGISGGADAIRYYADFAVLCRPVAQCLTGVSDALIALPDQPDFYTDDEGNITAGQSCTVLTGSYRQLALAATVLSTDPTFTALPQGPLLTAGSANDTQAYWDAAYAAAVAAGTLAAGKTYSAGGTGGVNTYPRNVTQACECTAATVAPVTPGNIALSAIVTDLCGRVGVVASQLDVTQLSDTVRGFVVGRQMGASDAIRSLQQGFFFDFPEWDLKLRGIKRGGASLWTITDDDFVWSDDDQDTRLQVLEFPRKINLVAADPDANYEPSKQTAERRTSNLNAISEQTVEIPVVFTVNEAAQRADVMLKIAWDEATGRWERELPEEFSGMCPSDPFTHDGKRWRAVKTETLDGSIKVEAVRDRPSSYTSLATGVTGVAPTPPVSSLRGPTIFAAMNLPSLRTSDNVPGMYLAATGILDGWIGAEIYLSVDGGLSETLVATITSPADMGKLTAAETASGEPLDVFMYSGTLESVTAEQIALRANGFAIQGNDRIAEIGQFRTATAIDANDFQLTNVNRGQMGTAAVAHAAGEQFVMLADAVFVPIDVTYAGRVLIFRAVSIGTVHENNPTYSIVFDPQFTQPEVIEFLLAENNQALQTESGIYLQVET